MNWLTIVQNISTFITGQFGIGLVTVAIGISGARSAITHQWGHFWSAVGGGCGVGAIVAGRTPIIRLGWRLDRSVAG
jgi:hypothetical protein